MSRGVAGLLTVLLIAGQPAPASAYLKFGTMVDGQPVAVRWDAPAIRYFITERDGPGVTAVQLRDAVGRAFGTWAAVETATVSAELLAFTAVPPDAGDGRTTIGFLDRPDLERVLGLTSVLLDTTGTIVEADVFFNTGFEWSAAPDGEPGRVDIESVALHEIGHLLGLGHSAIGETELLPSGGRRVIASGSLMFPIAFSPGSIANRVLQADDIAGISDLYPAPGFSADTGSVRGRVTRDGQGVFGAHVIAVDARSGTIVGGFTLDDDGEFVIAGLEPGPYIIRVEPLDDADPEGFFSQPPDLGFGVAYAPGFVVAPRGGTSSTVEIAVRAR